MPDLVRVGRVGRPHGLDGGFFVDGASERQEVFAKGATLYAGGEPATVVVSRRGSGGRPVIRLDREVERGSELASKRRPVGRSGGCARCSSTLGTTCSSSTPVRHFPSSRRASGRWIWPAGESLSPWGSQIPNSRLCASTSSPWFHTPMPG
jgi:hypothetical protein